MRDEPMPGQVNKAKPEPSGAFVSWEEAVLWLRGQQDRAELVRACYYDDPLLAAAERYRDSSEWLALRELLRDLPRGRALDVGAGRGISSYALAADGWQVTALEPDPSPVVGAGAVRQLAAQAGIAITVVEGECERLPFEECAFDLVLIRQALHHARDLKRFCREAARVLRPGGVFLAAREHVISRRSDLGAFLDSHPLHKLYGGEHAYLLEEYLGAFRQAGLDASRVLAPYDSDINLYPGSRDQVKQRLAARLGMTLPEFLFRRLAVPLLNRRDQTPGRLFTFMGVKR